MGISCGLTNGYCWVKVILTLCVSVWFMEKIDPLSDDPRNWCILGNKNVFCRRTVKVQKNITNLAGNRKRAICYLWLSTHSSPGKKLVMLNGYSSNPGLHKQLPCRFLTRMQICYPGWVFINLWSNILFLSGSISGGYKGLQDSIVIQNLSGFR